MDIRNTRSETTLHFSIKVLTGEVIVTMAITYLLATSHYSAKCNLPPFSNTKLLTKMRGEKIKIK